MPAATPVPEENVGTPAAPEAPARGAAEAPADPPAPPLPEVRQCQIPGHNEYGNAAVQGTGAMSGHWMVGNSENGGHWNTDAQVADWKVLS